MKKDTDAGNETLFSLRVTPGAQRNAVTAFKGGVWHVKIAAPPVEGRANEELRAYLSKKLDVSKNRISVVKGHTNRSKLIRVSGLAQKEVTFRLSVELNR